MRMSANHGPRQASRRIFDDRTACVRTAGGSREWSLRGGNFLVSYMIGASGDLLERDNPDEYFIYVLDGSIEIAALGTVVAAQDRTLAIVPGGHSTIRMLERSRVLRIFSAKADDLFAAAHNQCDYVEGAADFAPLGEGPLPHVGSSLRIYRLEDYADRAMRLFRAQNLMINLFDHSGPRDTAALTPHSHADFEQGSFAALGTWVHHLRRPWTAVMSDWRDDEHLTIVSPSLLIIPAGMIHTSHSVNAGAAQLIDVFAPPRRDFLERGLVSNADEYPPSPPKDTSPA